MRKCRITTVHVLAIVGFCSVAHSHTLTFDDVPSGTFLHDTFYMDTYRVAFDSLFQAADHSASSWGLPHSGSNVLVWAGSGSALELGGRILFGYYTAEYAEPDDVQSVDAYFSTDTGVMVRITAYRGIAPGTSVVVGSVVIGSPGESWDNRPVEISFPEGPFDRLDFEGVNYPEELLSLCADDMTVVPVPEPCSLLALAAGLGALALRRRR